MIRFSLLFPRLYDWSENFEVHVFYLTFTLLYMGQSIQEWTK